MLTSKQARQLLVLKPFPALLSNISYTQEDPLWIRQKHYSGFKSKEYSAKRYEYTKLGKILGYQTKRYISQLSGHLFYFSDSSSEEYLGYCSLQNVYVQWLQLQNNKFLLILSNGKEQSRFYFDQADFWKQQKEEITKYVIQMDFQLKYEVIEKIGQGSFSRVQKVKCRTTGNEYAAKYIPKVDKMEMPTKDMAASERQILYIMNDSHRTSMLNEFFENESQYIIVMEYLPGIDLMTMLRQSPEISLIKLKNLFRDILTILDECHSRNIIHRDIKPQNIMINPQNLQPKIIDFGLAIATNKQLQYRLYGKVGTLGYTAPQILNSNPQVYKSSSSKSDIFSFGVIVHMFLMGYNPLKGNTLAQTQKLNRQQFILDEQQILEKYGEPCLKFLKKLLAASPKQRYSAHEALNSSFLNQCCDKQQSMSTIEDLTSQKTIIFFKNGCQY